MAGFNNLLSLAMGYLPTQKVVFKKYLAETQSEVYADVPSYSAGVEYTASVQRVRADVYAQFGLKMQKKYKTVFISANAQGINEIKSPDKFSFGGRDWVVQTDLSDWYELDGWRAVLVVAENDYEWGAQ